MLYRKYENKEKGPGMAQSFIKLSRSDKKTKRASLASFFQIRTSQEKSAVIFSTSCSWNVSTLKRRHDVATNIRHGLTLAKTPTKRQKFYTYDVSNWGAAIVQWIRLCLTSDRLRFESQAHHLSFYQFIFKLCFVEKTNITKKRPGLTHFYTKFLI